MLWKLGVVMFELTGRKSRRRLRAKSILTWSWGVVTVLALVQQVICPTGFLAHVRYIGREITPSDLEQMARQRQAYFEDLRLSQAQRADQEIIQIFNRAWYCFEHFNFKIREKREEQEKVVESVKYNQINEEITKLIRLQYFSCILEREMQTQARLKVLRKAAEEEKARKKKLKELKKREKAAMMKAQRQIAQLKLEQQKREQERQERLRLIREEIEALKLSNQALRDRLRDIEAEKQRMLRAIADKRREIEELQRQLDAAGEKELEEVAEEDKPLVKKKQELEQELRRIRQAVDKAEAQLTAKIRELEALSQVVHIPTVLTPQDEQRLRQELQDLKNEAEQIRRQMEAEKAGHSTRRTQAEAEINRLMGELRTRQESIRTRMEKARQAMIDKINQAQSEEAAAKLAAANLAAEERALRELELEKEAIQKMRDARDEYARVLGELAAEREAIEQLSADVSTQTRNMEAENQRYQGFIRTKEAELKEVKSKAEAIKARLTGDSEALRRAEEENTRKAAALKADIQTIERQLQDLLARMQRLRAELSQLVQDIEKRKKPPPPPEEVRPTDLEAAVVSIPGIAALIKELVERAQRNAILTREECVELALLIASASLVRELAENRAEQERLLKLYQERCSMYPIDKLEDIKKMLKELGELRFWGERSGGNRLLCELLNKLLEEMEEKGLVSMTTIPTYISQAVALLRQLCEPHVPTRVIVPPVAFPLAEITCEALLEGAELMVRITYQSGSQRHVAGPFPLPPEATNTFQLFFYRIATIMYMQDGAAKQCGVIPEDILRQMRKPEITEQDLIYHEIVLEPSLLTFRPRRVVFQKSVQLTRATQKYNKLFEDSQWRAVTLTDDELAVVSKPKTQEKPSPNYDRLLLVLEEAIAKCHELIKMVEGYVFVFSMSMQHDAIRKALQAFEKHCSRLPGMGTVAQLIFELEQRALVRERYNFERQMLSDPYSFIVYGPFTRRHCQEVPSWVHEIKAYGSASIMASYLERIAVRFNKECVQFFGFPAMPVNPAWVAPHHNSEGFELHPILLHMIESSMKDVEEECKNNVTEITQLHLRMKDKRELTKADCELIIRELERLEVARNYKVVAYEMRRSELRDRVLKECYVKFPELKAARLVEVHDLTLTPLYRLSENCPFIYGRRMYRVQASLQWAERLVVQEPFVIEHHRDLLGRAEATKANDLMASVKAHLLSTGEELASVFKRAKDRDREASMGTSRLDPTVCQEIREFLLSEEMKNSLSHDDNIPSGLKDLRLVFGELCGYPFFQSQTAWTTLHQLDLHMFKIKKVRHFTAIYGQHVLVFEQKVRDRIKFDACTCDQLLTLIVDMREFTLNMKMNKLAAFRAMTDVELRAMTVLKKFCLNMKQYFAPVYKRQQGNANNEIGNKVRLHLHSVLDHFFEHEGTEGSVRRVNPFFKPDCILVQEMFSSFALNMVPNIFTAAMSTYISNCEILQTMPALPFLFPPFYDFTRYNPQNSPRKLTFSSRGFRIIADAGNYFRPLQNKQAQFVYLAAQGQSSRSISFPLAQAPFHPEPQAHFPVDVFSAAVGFAARHELLVQNKKMHTDHFQAQDLKDCQSAVKLVKAMYKTARQHGWRVSDLPRQVRFILEQARNYITKFCYLQHKAVGDQEKWLEFEEPQGEQEEEEEELNEDDF